MPERSGDQRKLAAIMFTDMVGYSALTQRNEALALGLLEEHRTLLRDLFPKFDGREVETTGDGFLVEFASALEASKCAIEIQRTIATRNLHVPSDRQIQVRIGIHVGDIVHKDGHVLGDGVNIAARLQPLAEPGGICVSVDVARQVQNNLEATVTRMGEAELKNIRMPMEIFRIVLPWEKGEVLGQAAVAAPSGSARDGRSLQNKVLLAVAGLVFLNLLVAVLYVGQRKGPSSRMPSEAQNDPAAGPQKSVAVLPFVNMSPDKADEYLSDGMTEELLNVLAKVKGLRVPGRSSSFAFKGKNEEGIFRTVGEKLHVQTVLEGSVRKSGNQLRVTAQLINVADGFHLWSETYDRDMTNIFAIQSDVAQKVTRALEIQLGVEEERMIKREPTQNLEAHKLYLQALYFHSKWSKADIKFAIDRVTRAIQLDPKFALAHAELSAALVDSIYLGEDPRLVIPKAKAAVIQALTLDRGLADCHTAMGFIHILELNWSEAERELKHALELDPGAFGAHDVYALYLAAMGRVEDALNEERLAQRLDPINTIVNLDLAYLLIAARQYDQGIAQCKYLLEMSPTTVAAKNHLALAYALKGDFQSALSLSEEANLADKGFSSELAQIYARAGRREEAVQIARNLQERSKESYIDLAEIGSIYAAVGARDDAFHWLELAIDQKSPFPAGILADPKYDGIRQDPRYPALLRRLGLPN